MDNQNDNLLSKVLGIKENPRTVKEKSVPEQEGPRKLLLNILGTSLKRINSRGVKKNG